MSVIAAIAEDAWGTADHRQARGRLRGGDLGAGGL